MKKIFSGVLSVLIPYLIFITDLDVAVKSLLVSAVCGVILTFFIVKAGGWVRLTREGKILSVPTILLVAVAIINVALALKIPAIALWSGYFGIIALAFIVSTRFSSAN